MIHLMSVVLLSSNSIVIAQTRPQLPQARWTAQLAYDPNAGHVLLFGGASASGLLNDLWSWDGMAWSQVASEGVPARNKAVFVFDPSRNVAVLFGGQTTSGDNAGDTWEWDGSTWKEIKLPGPEARVHAMGIYDEKNKQVLIFGGFGAKGMLRDTWAYDGTSWKLLNDDGPTALAHGIFYEYENSRPIMITAEQKLDANPKYMKNQPWGWTGSAWKPMGWLEARTSSSSLQALAYNNRDIILFDGDDVKEGKGKTWIFRHGKWTGSYLAGPGSRVGHAMIYDNGNRQIVMFGGSDRKNYFNDTWIWSEDKWSKVNHKK